MRILIVDDNKTFLEKLEQILRLDRHEVSSALSGKEALVKITEKEFDLLVTDLKMNDISGIELIRQLKSQGLNIMSIVVTGYGTIDTAVEAMKVGAFDYLLKPFEISILKSKLKEVEMELKLRKSLSQPITVSEELFKASFEQIDFNEHVNPFLIVSDVDPDEIREKYEIDEATIVRIGFNEGEDMIAPAKLHLLRQKMEEFVSTNRQGTIIFKGIEKLVMTHKWAYIRSFIDNLRQEILSSQFSLILLIDQKIPFMNVYQALLHDALSLVSVQAFNDIISIISHPTRKKVINLLKTNGKLNFNKIIEELRIDSSSGLAFHMKKLVQEGILEKEKNLYFLTARGHYLGEIIFDLEKIGFIDPGSRIKVLRYT
jgi:ActR/RegA family two-component response regulator/DNA-binding HxlR family transcriptional regulator